MTLADSESAQLARPVLALAALLSEKSVIDVDLTMFIPSELDLLRAFCDIGQRCLTEFSERALFALRDMHEKACRDHVSQPPAQDSAIAAPHACKMQKHGDEAANSIVEKQRGLSTSDEVTALFLSFLDARSLLRVMSLSQGWRPLAVADILWKPLVCKTWPGVTALCEVGLLQGSFHSLYHRRYKLDNAPNPLQRLEPETHKSLQKYACHFAVRNPASDRTVSGVFDMSESRSHDRLTVIVPPAQARFDLGREDRVDLPKLIQSLQLSVTVIRRADCKYLCLACGSNCFAAFEDSEDSESEDTGLFDYRGTTLIPRVLSDFSSGMEWDQRNPVLDHVIRLKIKLVDAGILVEGVEIFMYDDRSSEEPPPERVPSNWLLRFWEEIGAWV